MTVILSGFLLLPSLTTRVTFPEAVTSWWFWHFSSREILLSFLPKFLFIHFSCGQMTLTVQQNPALALPVKHSTPWVIKSWCMDCRVNILANKISLRETAYSGVLTGTALGVQYVQKASQWILFIHPFSQLLRNTQDITLTWQTPHFAQNLAKACPSDPYFSSCSLEWHLMEDLLGVGKLSL